jgi:hypothetical protein
MNIERLFGIRYFSSDVQDYSSNPLLGETADHVFCRDVRLPVRIYCAGRDDRDGGTG